jgi:putative endonuclease
VSGAAPRAGRERAGRRAERLAAWWLRLKGFRVLATRWRSPVGEVDLIARRGDLVVFVEVKRRATPDAAASSVTPAQRERVARAAEHFLARHREHAGAELRFDAVLVAPWSPPRHVPDAWRLDAVRDGYRTARARRRAPR